MGPPLPALLGRRQHLELARHTLERPSRAATGRPPRRHIARITIWPPVRPIDEPQMAPLGRPLGPLHTPAIMQPSCAGSSRPLASAGLSLTAARSPPPPSLGHRAGAHRHGCTCAPVCSSACLCASVRVCSADCVLHSVYYTVSSAYSALECDSARPVLWRTVCGGLWAAARLGRRQTRARLVHQVRRSNISPSF